MLEEQLDSLEVELDKALEKVRAYENDEWVMYDCDICVTLGHCRNPWRSKEESYKHILKQLMESETREAEMFQQAEDMQVGVYSLQGFPLDSILPF